MIGTTAGYGKVIRIDQRGEYKVSLKYFHQDDGIQLAIQQGSWLSGRVDVTQNGNKNLLSANQSGAVGWWRGNTQGNNNQTEITQYGESDLFGYNQTGDANTPRVNQSGTYSSAESTTFGNNNIVDISQGGGGSIDIDQCRDLTIARIEKVSPMTIRIAQR